MNMGRVRCAAVGCEHRGPVSYHRFPKEPYIREKWLHFCRRKPGFNPESARVCGRHFTEDDFEKNTDREHLGPSFNKRRLKKDSIPSIRPFKRVREDAELTIKSAQSNGTQDFLSRLEPQTILIDGGNSLPSDLFASVFDENPDYSVDNASSNGSSSSSTTLRRSTRTRYTTREDEMTNAILIDDSSNDGSSRKGEENSRVRRNLTRKSYFPATKKGAAYDEKGHLIQNGLDLCDCFDQECPGCHFPCNKCKSPKCAHECRVNRRWQFETIEIDGVQGSHRRNMNIQKKMVTSNY